MSVEAVKGFIEKIGGDEALAEKFKAAGTDVDEVIRLGKENGFEFTAQDMKAVHDEMSQSGTELSDEDLEKVAGGFVTSTVAAVVTSSIAVVTAAVSVADAATSAASKR